MHCCVSNYYLYFTVGEPCQEPIVYSVSGNDYELIRSNDHGVCYAPNPRYYGQKIQTPYSQMQGWHAKAATSISLCEEEDGNDEGCKVVPDVIGKTT